MRVLITGGAGFIGRYLAEALQQRGDSVTILDLRQPEFDGPHRVVVGDVRHDAAVAAAMEGVEAVFHLAAAHHDHGLARETYFAVNEAGTRQICTEASRRGIHRICFYSSCAVYGGAEAPRDEEADPRPEAPYGASKLAGEHVLAAWASEDQRRRVLILRPTVVFGPRNVANMFSLIRQIDSGWFAQIGPGSNRKSVAYVENLVAATLHLWDAQQDGPVSHFNYVDKPDLTSAEICAVITSELGRRAGPRIPLGAAMAAAVPFEMAARVLGRNLPISRARVLKLAEAETVFAAERIRRSGFAPGVPLDTGLRRMVAWYQGEGRSLRPKAALPPADVVREVRVVPEASAAI